MKALSLDEALREAENRLDHDRARVTQSIALRSAQVKHVIKNLLEFTHEKGENALTARLETMIPPMSSEKLISYALETHEKVSGTLTPLLQNKALQLEGKERAALLRWVTELDDTLLDIRRIAVQNLSKHPAMKPYQLLSQVENKEEEIESRHRQAQDWATEVAKCVYQRDALERELLAMRDQPGFDTFSRLEGSRNTLVQQKKELGDAWGTTWSSVEPILHILNEKSPVFSKMENAQARVLQLYLANPLTARSRDTHGAGLLMILRMGVDALEEKKSGLSKLEKEQARAIILSALENPIFVRYYEMVREWENALEANQREYYAHPFFERRATLERSLQEWERALVHAREQENVSSQELVRVREQYARTWKEADDLCRLNLGFSLNPN